MRDVTIWLKVES